MHIRPEVIYLTDHRQQPYVFAIYMVSTLPYLDTYLILTSAHPCFDNKWVSVPVDPSSPRLVGRPVDYNHLPVQVLGLIKSEVDECEIYTNATAYKHIKEQPYAK